jgi:hypothetical protein
MREEERMTQSWVEVRGEGVFLMEERETCGELPLGEDYDKVNKTDRESRLEINRGLHIGGPRTMSHNTGSFEIILNLEIESALFGPMAIGARLCYSRKSAI